MRGPVTLLKDAWGIFKANPKLFFGIYLIPALLNMAFVIIFSNDAEAVISEGNILLFFISSLILAIAFIFMGIAMIKAVSNPREITVGEAYGAAKKYALSYVWVAVLVGVSVMFGFILFIIPGIIFAVWFAFSYFVLLYEDKHSVDALKASKAYVKGHFWAVLGRYAFLVLVAIVVSVVVGMATAISASIAGEIGAGVVAFVFNAIVTPVAIGYSYLMYKDLSSKAHVKEMNAAEESTDGMVENPA